MLKLLFFTFFWRNLCVFFNVFSLLRGIFVAISVDNLFAHMQIDLFLINSTDMPKKRKRCTEPALYCDVCLQNLHCIGREKSLTKVDLVHIRKNIQSLSCLVSKCESQCVFVNIYMSVCERLRVPVSVCECVNDCQCRLCVHVFTIMFCICVSCLFSNVVCFAFMFCIFILHLWVSFMFYICVS